MARTKLWLIATVILLLLSHSWAKGAAWAKTSNDGKIPTFSTAPNDTTPDQGFNRTENSTSNYWDQLIPPFHEFSNSTADRADLNRLDKHVFLLNDENIVNSQVKTWYAAWTRVAQKQPLWQSHGETYVFLNDFHSDLDYYCNIGVPACLHQPNADDIIDKWPGEENRALAQRIYLVFELMQMDHAERKLGLEVLRDVAKFLSDHSHHIITLVTQQIDPAAKTVCDIIHKIIDLSIQIAASMAAGAATSLSNIFSSDTNLLKMLLELNILPPEQMTELVSKLLVPKKFDWIEKIVIEQFANGAADLAKDYTKRMGKVVVNKNSTLPDDMGEKRINPGIGRDPMCSEFDGDIEDNNEANSHVLKELVSTWYDRRIFDERSLFEKMYNGSNTEPGAPSVRALYFNSRHWAPLYGPGSTRSRLANSAEFGTRVKMRMLKYFLGRVMSEDDSYIACMHREDAQEQCSMNATEQPQPYLQKYRKTMFCPKPEMPTLLCQAARWRHTTGFTSHITPIPGIDEIPTWKIGEAQLTIEGLIREAFEHYVRYGNGDNDMVDWSAEDPQAPAFFLPVCVNEAHNELRLHDMNPAHFKSQSHVQFPFKCGDWRANESVGFMQAMNLGPGSRIYEEIEGPANGTQHPNGLFWNQIPKLLEERDTISPISHYLTLCANGIRLPELSDDHDNNPAFNGEKPHRGGDKDCNYIQQNVYNMTHSEANTWFCENLGNHTVFKRQRQYYFLPQTLTAKPVHKTRCKNWPKQEKKIKINEENRKLQVAENLKIKEENTRKEDEKKAKAEENKKKLEEEKNDKKEKKVKEQVKTVEDKRPKEEEKVKKEGGN